MSFLVVTALTLGLIAFAPVLNPARRPAPIR